MKRKGHLIQAVSEDGIACEMGIEPGDRLLEINGETVEDVFDYQYMIEEEYGEDTKFDVHTINFDAGQKISDIDKVSKKRICLIAN